MKILILSDGKYGERAFELIKNAFPETSMVIIEEMDPNQFLDEYDFPNDVDAAIKESDLVISYVRHPDVASELCYYEKPVILGIFFGEGFVRQVQNDNPLVVMPSSMCHLLPDSKSEVINEFATKFGKPEYLIQLDDPGGRPPIISKIELHCQSPCGGSKVGMDCLVGKGVTTKLLNEFAMVIRQECREPVSLIIRRQMAEVSTINHLKSLLDALKEANPALFKQGTELQKYADQFKESA